MIVFQTEMLRSSDAWSNTPFLWDQPFDYPRTNLAGKPFLLRTRNLLVPDERAVRSCSQRTTVRGKDPVANGNG